MQPIPFGAMRQRGCSQMCQLMLRSRQSRAARWDVGQRERREGPAGGARPANGSAGREQGEGRAGKQVGAGSSKQKGEGAWGHSSEAWDKGAGEAARHPQPHGSEAGLLLAAAGHIELPVLQQPGGQRRQVHQRQRHHWQWEQWHSMPGWLHRLATRGKGCCHPLPPCTASTPPPPPSPLTMMSPSCTSYVLPSCRQLPADLTAAGAGRARRGGG